MPFYGCTLIGIEILREEFMRKFAFSLLAIAFTLSITGNFPAQTQSVPATSPHLPRGTATDISNSEIEALVRKMAAERVGDQAIRIVSINSEYHLAMAVVSRLKTTPNKAPSAVEHSDITEIYHVISGSGTLVTGGMLKDSRKIPPNDESHYIERAQYGRQQHSEWCEPQNRSR